MIMVRHELILVAVSICFAGLSCAERHKGNNRPRKRHKTDEYRRPDFARGLPPPFPDPTEVKPITTQEPNSFLKSVPFKLGHIDTFKRLRTPLRAKDVVEDPEYDNNTDVGYNTSDPDKTPYDGEHVLQDWTKWLHNEKTNNLLGNINSKTSNSHSRDGGVAKNENIGQDVDGLFYEEDDDDDGGVDFREDVPAKKNHYPAAKELSSSQLLLLVAGLFFGSILLCAVCAYTRNKTRSKKNAQCDSHEAVSLCAREPSSQANNIYCPRPLYPQAYPGQTLDTLDRQPYLELLNDTTEDDIVEPPPVIGGSDQTEGIDAVEHHTSGRTTVEINT